MNLICVLVQEGVLTLRFLKTLRVLAWGLLEVVVVHLWKIIMLSLGVVMLTMQGEVKSWLGLAATVQFTPRSILSTISLFTQTATCSLSPLYKRVLLSLYLLCVVSSVRPPNYNTSFLLSELMVTRSRQLPDCVMSLRKMPRGVKCHSVITWFNVLYVQGTLDYMDRLTQCHVHCSREHLTLPRVFKGKWLPAQKLACKGYCVPCGRVYIS
jgi:hypothetical protein